MNSCHIFSLFFILSIHSVDCFLCCILVSCVLGLSIQKNHCYYLNLEVFLLCFLLVFSVSQILHLGFWSILGWFLWRWRRGIQFQYSVIWNYIQFSQCHLLNRLSILQCIFLIFLSGSFLMNNLFLGSLFYLSMCLFHVITVLFFFSYYGSVLFLEIKGCDTPSFDLLDQECFGYLEVFCASIWILGCSCYFCEESSLVFW
jgi:hypothetical protein